jgi:hypothetical protein
MTDATAQSFVKLNIKSADGNIVMKTGIGETKRVTPPAQGMITGREFTIDTTWSFSYDFKHFHSIKFLFDAVIDTGRL